jgi:hypothetical protein
MFLGRCAILRLSFPTIVPHPVPSIGSYSTDAQSSSLAQHTPTKVTRRRLVRRWAKDDPPKWSRDTPPHVILKEVRAGIPRFPSPLVRARNLTNLEEVHESLHEYETARTREDYTLEHYSAKELRALAHRAVNLGFLPVIDHLATDLLAAMGCRAKPRELWPMASPLLLPRSPLVHPDKSVAFLGLLEPDFSKFPLSPQSFRIILNAVVLHPDPTANSLKIVATHLIPRLRRVIAPSGVSSITYNPPAIVSTSFRLVRKLLNLQQEGTAMQVLGELVNTGHIPPEAMKVSQVEPHNFSFTIFATLMQSTLHWDWRGEAAATALDLLMSQEGQDSMRSAIPLVLDVIRTFLDGPSSDDIADCRRLLCEIDHRASRDFMIPHDVIFSFYNKTWKLGMPSEAESFYDYTQSDVVERKQYPPPVGSALTWLLRHLTDKSGNRHLGRRLVRQVATSNELIPLQDRAQFIGISVEHGYATHARALWVKYSLEKYRERVVGSPVVMLRLVSTFANLISRVNEKLDRVKEQKEHEEKGILSGERYRPIGYFAAKRLYDERGQLVDEHRETGPDVYREQLEDFTMFSECVIEEFRKVHEPLSTAHHFTLNALARAYFIFGNLHAGFDTMKHLLDRKEVPNGRDINVLLDAMASFDARRAAHTIDQMMQRGLRPTQVTFGTVLHHAALGRDTELVSALVQKAQDFLGKLSPLAISLLIRHLVDSRGRTRAELSFGLQETLKIVRAMKNRRLYARSDLGKRCIFLSLRSNNPIMAFEFWERLVKTRTEWGDDEQVHQRRLIAQQIKVHRSSGWLSSQKSAEMLAELRESDGCLDQGLGSE